MGRGNGGVKHFTQARAGLCSMSVCPLLEDAAMWANTAYLMGPRQNGSLRGSWKAGSDVLEMDTSTHLELGEPESQMGFPCGSVVKNLLANAGDPSSIPPGSGRSPGKELATHSSILVWRIVWREESGGLQFMGWQKVEHDWVTEHHHWVIWLKGNWIQVTVTLCRGTV